MSKCKCKCKNDCLYTTTNVLNGVCVDGLLGTVPDCCCNPCGCNKECGCGCGFNDCSYTTLCDSYCEKDCGCGCECCEPCCCECHKPDPCCCECHKPEPCDCNCGCECDCHEPPPCECDCGCSVKELAGKIACLVEEYVRDCCK